MSRSISFDESNKFEYQSLYNTINLMATYRNLTMKPSYEKAITLKGMNGL